MASCAASDLFGREHERGALHLLDRPRDRGALAAAGDAEQRLEAVAALDAFGELLDRVRLVAGGLEVGDDRNGGTDRCYRGGVTLPPDGDAWCGSERMQSHTSATFASNASRSPGVVDDDVRFCQTVLA